MAAGIELSINFLPVYFDTPDFVEIFASQCEEHSHRHDLPGGRSIRLACASLLL
jgi:protoheme ferro-lyase